MTTVKDTPVLNWLAVLLTLFLFVVWFHRARKPNRGAQQKVDATSNVDLVVMMTGAVILPFALSYLHHNLFELPQMALEAGGFILLISLLAIFACVCVFLLIGARMKSIDAKPKCLNCAKTGRRLSTRKISLLTLRIS